MGTQPHRFTFWSLVCTLTPTDVTRVHSPLHIPRFKILHNGREICQQYVMEMGMPLKTGSTYVRTYVRWKHLVAAFQMCVSEPVHVGMSPVKQKWCQEPLREKHVSAIHHCCAGSQMSPAPACLPPFALPPLAHLSTALHWRQIQVAHSVWIVIVGVLLLLLLFLKGCLSHRDKNVNLAINMHGEKTQILPFAPGYVISPRPCQVLTLQVQPD